LFPKPIRLNYVIPYSLKALPAVLIWIMIGIELMVGNGREHAIVKKIDQST